MTDMLSAEQLKILQAFDTPTVCDAVEKTKVRGRMEGYANEALRCLTPGLGSMVGYAVTVTVDYTTPDLRPDHKIWLAWVKAMETVPKPGVLVIKDGGPQRGRAALFGDVMGAVAKCVGVVGVVADGPVRDFPQFDRIAMHCFATGLIASHGNPRVIAVNEPVEVQGLAIRPGDLLHGDSNGLITVPLPVVDRVVAEAPLISAEEAGLINYARTPGFTVDGLYRLRYGVSA